MDTTWEFLIVSCLKVQLCKSTYRAASETRMIPSNDGILVAERSAEDTNFIEASISLGTDNHRTAERTFATIVNENCVHIVIVNSA